MIKTMNITMNTNYEHKYKKGKRKTMNDYDRYNMND